MDPASLAVGLGTSLLPSIFDEITGASAARKKAIADRDRQLMMFIDELEAEAGPDVTQSLFFKTGTAQLDKRDKQLREADTQTSAAEGASEETKLARMQNRNEGYSGSLLDLLRGAQGERQRLKALKKQLQMQRLGLAVDEANAGVQKLGQLSTGIAGMVPYLFDDDDDDDDDDDGTGSETTAGATTTTTQKPYTKRPMSLLRGPYQPN